MGDIHDREVPDAEADLQVAHLLKLAGRRAMPDAAQMSRARAAARAEWLRAAGRPRWRVSWWAVSCAAAVVGIGIIGALSLRSPTTAVGTAVGTLEVLVGTLVTTSNGEGERVIGERGLEIKSGDRIDISDGSRAAFRLVDGTAVRVDEGTILTFDIDRVVLHRGAAYVDSSREAHRSSLIVETALGSVRHLGTQFEVRLIGEALRVRVREGMVAVGDRGPAWTLGAGEELLVAPGRSPGRGLVATSGPDWRWIGELAPPFRLEGTTVAAFLEWVAREHGWQWRFESTALQKRVQQIVLHGSIENMTPEEALAAVLPTCGLTSHLEGNQLIVRASAARR